MDKPAPLVRAPSKQCHDTGIPKVARLALLLITILLFASAPSLLFQPLTISLTHNDPWEGLAAHCKDAQPIRTAEFLERQRQLAHALLALNGSTYVAEPGASALFFGNISDASWHLSERPLLLLISPLVDQGEVSARVTILTPTFEEDRAKLLTIPGVDVSYVAWHEDEDPYTIAVNALPTSNRGPIYVDGMTRHFIVDGFEKAAPGLSVLLAPAAITSLRERKSPTEIALLKCANEVTVLAIRAVQAQMHIGMRESQVIQMVDEALAVAGLTERWGTEENAALPHGTGTDRVLGRSDFILIDTGGVLFGYHSDVTRTFQLEESEIPEDYARIWWDVHAAQTAAMRVARAGVITAEVDKAARAELARRGLSPYFTHRLGHGIGLEDHEAPYLRGGSDIVINSGHTFSNEPGVYIKGKVGIRLEDCFYINDGGAAVYLTEDVGAQARDPLHP
ncbi:peptidase M24, structural domain-containing protein [Boletus edulis BED1]|uniref:Peptidase M24, structural domain-containing protein n=1 Tax=Boletus edulis BED1 TaxID=1328754 RepID=A0AAD4BQH8_BOLED|nr:peptidase M24, structural domain-containing protein [Boletus edulis BED1]